ncbi:MAG: phosphotransferase family protein [Acidimicrobiales bacterium]
MTAPTTEHELAEYLTGALGEPVRVGRLARVAMGQSRAMYLLDGTVGGVERRMVVRVEQHGMLGSDSTTEVPVMQALFRAGFPVAEVLAYEPTGQVIGQPFFVMSFVPGVSTEDPATLDEYLRLLHELHHFDPVALGLDALPVPTLPIGPAHALVDRWDATYRSGLVGEPSPLLDEAIAHLRRTAPATDRLCIVHADPGPGNYMHLDGRITALVDWEFTHLGDEYDDWAYLIYMRGRRALTPDEWIERIRQVTGVEIDRERLRYWRGVNHLMGAAIDQTCTKLYHDRTVPVPNLLAIGTGVHLSALRRLYDVVLA